MNQYLAINYFFLCVWQNVASNLYIFDHQRVNISLGSMLERFHTMIKGGSLWDLKLCEMRVLAIQPFTWVRFQTTSEHVLTVGSICHQMFRMIYWWQYWYQISNVYDVKLCLSNADVNISLYAKCIHVKSYFYIRSSFFFKLSVAVIGIFQSQQQNTFEIKKLSLR